MHKNGSRETFPERLRRLRKRKKIRQSVLSELCGLSPSMVCKYENGDRTPSVETVTAIADYFEVSLDYLLCREGWEGGGHR